MTHATYGIFQLPPRAGVLREYVSKRPHIKLNNAQSNCPHKNDTVCVPARADCWMNGWVCAITQLLLMIRPLVDFASDADVVAQRQANEGSVELA